MADIARIEERLDRVAAGNTAVSDSIGGIAFQNMTEVMEFSKLMSLSGNAVPKHLQGNPGMCLAVCIQAMEWRFSPFAVANKSYEVQSRLSFESQLVHAVIEQRAPIVGRLRHRFEGEGDERVCIVWATLRETSEVLEYRSPPFSKILPKNSPLWKTKPDLQQYYNTSRDFCRAYFPDVLLGVYTQDELRDHVGPDNAKDVNSRPSVGDRLKNKGARGFSASHVERETRGGVVDEPSSNKGEANQKTELHEQDSNAGTVTTQVDAAQVDQAGEEPAAESISSQESPHDAATDAPASSGSPALDAGNLSETSDASPSGGEAQAGETSQGTGLPSNLPTGWEILYAAALRRAQKKESLEKYAKQFWDERGGWAAIKATVDGVAASAIFNVFRDHFGNKEAIDRELREIV